MIPAPLFLLGVLLIALSQGVAAYGAAVMVRATSGPEMALGGVAMGVGMAMAAAVVSDLRRSRP